MRSLYNYNDQNNRPKMNGKCLAAIIIVTLGILLCVEVITSTITEEHREQRIMNLVKSGIDPIKAGCTFSIYDDVGKIKESCKQ